MKKIESINQYLLERYPNLWNTKLVWMLIIGFVLHCLFFAFGYYTHTSPESMQVYNVSNDFFDNGVFSVQLIISILLLTAWLVFMFKNNAFKSFYPISRGQLFGQFFQYVMIFFVSISFYFSYMYGLKVIVLQKYSPEIMQKDIKKINLGAAFLSQDFDKYTISKKAYPEVLQQLYCETSIENIDPNQKTFHFLNFDYQFYSIKKISVLKGTENSVCEDLVPNDSLQNNYLYSSTLNDSCEFYYKDKVIDISPYIKTSGLSYYNYSTVFYTNEDINVRSNAAYYAYENNVNLYTNPIAESQMNKKVSEILDSKNPELFKKTLSDFLEVSRRYKIDTNLTVDSWMKFAYHPDFLK